MNFGVYSIRNVRTFKGMEGMGGFNLTLCKNGKAIGEVINDDSGGCNMYRLDRTEQAELDAFAKAQLPKEKFEVTDMFISAMLDAYEVAKQIKRWCKTKTVFRLKGEKEGTFHTMMAPYSDPRIRPHLDKTYAGTIAELYNEKGERII